MLAGVVEGFYGPMWDFINRLSVIELLGRLEMSVYIYGPKWDPFHRDRWRSPYPLSFEEEVARLVDAGKRFGVEFAFALSPGLDIDYGSEEDIRLLVRKFERFMELGVEYIALFLDDIPPTLRGKGFRTLAEAQAHLVNKVFRELRPRKLIFCPTHYFGTPRDYLSQLGQLLDPEIEIMWTGMWVCSHRIDCEHLEKIAEIMGRKPFIWENYPVNDYFTCRGITRLHLGPLKNRCSELPKMVSGYVLNPANQVEVSKIVLHIAHTMLVSGPSYDPDRALRDAISYLVNRSARYWFERFAEFNRASFMDLREATITRENADEVLEIVKSLRETLSNRELLKEIQLVLNKMEAIARYAKGERVALSWRVQTSGEYNPPLTDEAMEREMFGVVARAKPWYVDAYPKPEWY